MSADAAYLVTRALVAALAQAGVEVVAVCAGSRSTSLALAFHDDGRFKVFSFIDERSAGFFALGAARATGKTAVVVTTSGTAVANLHPAAVEARMAGVPLLLLTADRPPELHDVGALQTVEQAGSLTAAIWSADLHTYDDAMLTHAPRLAVQAVARAGVGGPVHVNVRFREPLVPSREVRAQSVDGVIMTRWNSPVLAPDPDEIDRVASAIRGTPRGLIYLGHLEGEHHGLGAAVGRLSRTAGYPVAAEATSRLRGKVTGAHLVDAAEALVRAESFEALHRPDLVVRFGRAPLTRRMLEWLDGFGAEQIAVAPRLPWPDPGGAIGRIIAADESAACDSLADALDGYAGGTEWSSAWTSASSKARAAVDEFIDSAPFFEGSVARSVARSLPDDACLVASTSLPIRALDAFSPSAIALQAFASRGANGIDGTTSVAMGVAAATGRPTVCLTGDVAFLHDVGGLFAAARHGIPLVTVVIDNGGGGIFEFLPQGTHIERETFEDLFATSHTLDLLHAAELYGLQFASVHDAGELDRVLKWAFTEGKAWVIRAAVNRGVSLEAHRGAWAAVEAAL